MNERTCNRCFKTKAYIYSAIHTVDTIRIHLDDTGARWQGFRCPQCVNELQKERNHKKKKERELEAEKNMKVDELHTRRVQ